MEVRAKEDRLFARWRGEYESRGEKRFVVDGAPNPQTFVKSHRRTVFVLKDPNFAAAERDEPRIFQLREQLQFNPDPLWQGVAKWCVCISRLPERLSWDALPDTRATYCRAECPGLQTTEIDRIAEYQFRHVQFRWFDRPSIWRYLLVSTAIARCREIPTVDTYCLQLSAGELMPT